MSNATLRPMEPGDYDTFLSFYKELHRIHQEAMPDIFRPGVGFPPREVFEADLKREDHEMILAVSEGKPAGMCVLLWKAVPDDPNYPLLPRVNGHIDDLYVAPEFRRQGIATLLCREAERLAYEKGVQTLSLMVWSFNEKAMALYRKEGFEPVMYNLEKRL